MWGAVNVGRPTPHCVALTITLGRVPQLRLALNQIDSTVGDLAGNAEAVVRWTRHSAEQGAHLVAFPEMVLTGYPVEDLALRQSFVEASRAALKALAARLADEGFGELPVIVGYLDRSESAAPKYGHHGLASRDADSDPSKISTPSKTRYTGATASHVDNDKTGPASANAPSNNATAPRDPSAHHERRSTPVAALPNAVSTEVTRLGRTLASVCVSISPSRGYSRGGDPSRSP